MGEQTVNYTEEQVSVLVAAYVKNPGNEVVANFAEKFGKSVASIRSKLVREGVYQKEKHVKTVTYSDQGPTKAEILADLSEVTPFDAEGLKGATKTALRDVLVWYQKVTAPAEDVEAA
jgi:hypothetical protein